MPSTVTYLLGFLGVLKAISAAPAAACQLQWGGATVDGHLGNNNVCRYNIKYGQAERWGESSAAASTPSDASGMPPVCVQPAIFWSESNMSEDCLNLVVYVPSGANGNTPIFTWLHGGSNAIGGASQAGIDGEALAAKGQIVVVPQYRLGLFGFLPPASSPAASDPNLAVRDVVLAIKSVRTKLGTGNKNLITVGGQSTGATLIRALWSAPSASGLFHRMILQSDASGFSLSTVAQYKAVRSEVYGYDALAGKSLSALKQLPASTLAAANMQLQQSHYAMPYASDTLNPVFGTATIPKEPTKALTSSPSSLAVKPYNVPLFITSTKDDGALAVGSYYYGDVDEPAGSPWEGARYLQGIQNVKCGAGVDSLTITNVPEYAYSSYTGSDRTRAALSLIATDAIWRCPARTVASAWAKNGGKVYVAEFNAAAGSYLYSSSVPYCAGKVCHGNDIPVVFGNDNSIGNEAIDHWSTFIQGNDLSWNTYSANAAQSHANVKAIGGGDVSSCPADFWGNQCKFLWQ